MESKLKQLKEDLSSPEEMSMEDHIALRIEDSSEDESMSQTDYPQSDVSMSVADDDCHWKGTSIVELQHSYGRWGPPPSPNVVPSENHTVLIRLPVRQGEVPKSFPTRHQDRWDQDHVRMPFSSFSLYPVQENGETSLRARWELVNEALLKSIMSSKQLEAAIFSYNSRYNEKWDFKALHTYFNEVLEEEEVENFFESVFPRVVQLALQLPDLVTGPVPLLRRERAHAITLSQLQIASLLANALLCTFPRRNSTKRGSEYASYPDINFNRLFQCGSTDSSSYIMGKFKCIFNYFRRVSRRAPTGVVTFVRRYIRPGSLPQWSRSTKMLPKLHVSSAGTIEDDGAGMLQVDFANKFVGGGVLGWGCVQEEIRFLICPELLVARLFTEALEPTEALVIVGCEQFNMYSGYSDSFEWAGNFEDTTGSDSFSRKHCSIVAIDAVMFTLAKEQFTVRCISRELNKAYAGFHDPDWLADPRKKKIPLPAVATGNWGCGAFRGDAKLKALIQLMAAAEAGRPLAYFTFNDKQLRDQIFDMHKYFYDRGVTVGRLWNLLCRYSKETETNRMNRPQLYQFLYQMVDWPSPSSAQPSFCKQSPSPGPKQKTENRPQPLSDRTHSLLAEAGYTPEYLDAMLENIANDEPATPNLNQSNDNSQEEITSLQRCTEKVEICDDDERQRSVSEYFQPKATTARTETSCSPTDNAASRAVSILGMLELEENVGGSNSSVKKRTGVFNAEMSPLDNVPVSNNSTEEETSDQKAKRAKWPKPQNAKRKISDYFGVVQS